jgi:hypothetical protein
MKAPTLGPRTFLLPWILAALAACGSVGDGDVPDVPPSGDVNLSVDAPGPGDVSADAARPDAPPEAVGGVVWKEDPAAAWNCERPGICIDDYRRFIELAAAHAKPIEEGATVAKLQAIDGGQVASVPGPLSAQELRDVVVDTLNIGFLLDGLDDRLLTVTATGVIEHGDSVETRFLLEDPWVGTFEAILMTPKGQGPFPAVVAQHGHGDSAAVYRDDYHGAEYPAHGLAILMVTYRAMANGIDGVMEHVISSELLDQGFTLMGLRVYEGLLCLKVLRHLPSIDPTRIGLIGHSGGSSTGNLSVRLGLGFAAYVSDYRVDYAEWVPEMQGFHCETVPDLYPWAALVNDLSTNAIPTLTVPYKYTDGMAPIFAFFAEHLESAAVP